jgi:hypothetical protein
MEKEIRKIALEKVLTALNSQGMGYCATTGNEEKANSLSPYSILHFLHHFLQTL